MAEELEAGALETAVALKDAIALELRRLGATVCVLLCVSYLW